MGKGDKDSELWERVAETATPLKGRKRPGAKAASGAPPPVAEAEETPRPVKPKIRPAPKPRPPAAAVTLDRQTARQLEKGQTPIEARLDLHGLRQRDAHAQLHRFLATAQARGLRHVLVITGKGESPVEATSFYQEEERGVLKNAVPQWLASGDFAPLVVSFSPAPRRLGGEGALYVRVRKGRLARD
jgi:DNA-nicking Smr family endonuclease